MTEQMWKIFFTLEMIGMELFVSDPDAPMVIIVPESQVKSRVIAFNAMETTTIVNITMV